MKTDKKRSKRKIFAFIIFFICMREKKVVEPNNFLFLFSLFLRFDWMNIQTDKLEKLPTYLSNSLSNRNLHNFEIMTNKKQYL